LATPLTGKELVFAALRHETITSVPWVPFAGVHAGKLKGYTAREVLTNEDKLVESLLEVNRTYDPDGQPVIFDLQVEAEILGCPLIWAENSPPSVAGHPLASNFIIPTHLPERADGRLPLILNAMWRMKTTVGYRTALYGLVTGPFTLASHLRGTEIFMDMIEQAEKVDEILQYTTAVCKRMAELYIGAGMDVIAVVDPLVSQVSPRHFKRFFSVPFKEIFDFIRAKAVFSSFFVCGDATKNIEEMCQTGPDCISIDENIHLPTAKAITDRYNITIGGNIPLTTRMLLGSQQDNMKFIVDLLETVNEPNYILSPGCDMPYDTPIENVTGVLQAVRSPVSTRAALEHYISAPVDIDVELPDYAHLTRVLMEVFTLDSASCAACGYMVDAAKQAAEELDGQVDWVEYKFTSLENIARMQKLGVKNLPSIYLNGELKFSSIIPGKKELIAAIAELQRI
jgi:uroporphyrinogen decarboxylase